jgi:hypothetical protein
MKGGERHGGDFIGSARRLLPVATICHARQKAVAAGLGAERDNLPHYFFDVG